MEAQIENAIQIGWDHRSAPALKTQAFEFLQQLRQDPSAWQVCATLFTHSPRKAEVVRLVSLEVVNNAIESQKLDTSGLMFLKDNLLDYVRRTYGPNAQDDIDPPSLQNKLTQTLTYLFAGLYSGGWETFITDFLALTRSPSSSDGRPDNMRGVMLYLRLLGSVHDEIADVMLSRVSSEGKRNTDLKDAVRARDMQTVVKSLQDVLSVYGNRDDTITEMTMRVLGKWVSWIDISLVISQDMLNLIFPVIGRPNPNCLEDKVRDAAIDAFNEIVGKKMKAADKTEMISFLNLRDIISELVQSAPLHDYQRTHRYDTDLGVAVAKLTNTVMTDVIRVLEDRSIGNDTRAKAERHLQDFLPLLLRFFGDEYDEICSTVIPSLTDLLTFLRKVPNLPPASHEMLRPILDAIMRKMRFDETSAWGDGEEGLDEEAEFQELRKRLQNLQKSVAAVDENLFVETLSNLVANTLQRLDEQGDQMDWRDLELALHELLLFGEFALPNQGVAPKSQPSTAASERLTVIMQKLVHSGVANFPHPVALLQYMEICVRHCFFFETNQECIPRVLENFIRLVHHNHPRVRIRSWYLFYRFVRQLRTQVGNVAETVIQSIADLLPIKAELPNEESSDDMSSDETDNSADALFTGQLYLFEAIGRISSTQATPPDKQALYARSVMEPLFADIQTYLPRAKSGDAQAVLQVHHVILALGTLAYGFSDHSQKPSQRQAADKQVADEFSRAAEAILIALRELNALSEIRAASRSAFSRMLTVLGAAVLPQLPQWIEGLLSQSSSKDEMAMFLRLLDLVVFGFKAEIYRVLNLLLTPLLQRIFAGLAEPISGTDDEIQLAELRREYLAFLQIILDNDLSGVLVSEENQGFFDSLVASVITLARTIGHGNMVASRLAFCTLTRIASVWGGPDVANISANPSAPTGAPTPVIPGFDQFMIERFHPVCWEVLQDPQFNPGKDAQTRQVLTEIAALEQVIYTKTGEVFIQHLQASLFPVLGIDGTDFLRSMTTSTEKKVFGTYLQGLLKGRR